jgi:hypothetical protein
MKPNFRKISKNLVFANSNASEMDLSPTWYVKKIIKNV